MSRKIFVALLGATIMASNPVFAAEQSLDLKTVLAEALQNHPAIISAEKNWQAEVNKITPAKTLPNPEFGIMKDDIPAGTLDFNKGMMTEYALSQEIMYPGKLSLMGKMAANQALMAKASYQEQRVNIYGDAKQSYYDLLYATKALEIEKETQQLMGQIAKIAQINYATGMVPLADTLRAQTEFSNMTADLVNMAAMETVAKAKVNNVMGRSSHALLTVKEEFNALPLACWRPLHGGITHTLTDNRPPPLRRGRTDK